MHFLPDFAPLIARHGYLVVGFVVGLESMGVPMPGETLLVAAALYAAATGQLDIGWVVLAACTGAVMGDNLGYLIGRKLGTPALERYGPRFGLHRRRLLLGRWLFQKHGAPVVFFGRFTALLRTFAALLAGANQMGWGHFLLWNLLGGLAWSSLFGFGAFYLGERVLSFAWPVAAAITAVIIVAVIWGMIMLRRHEERWLDHAEQALAAQASASR